MRRKSTIAIAGIFTAALTMAGPAVPAHACHNDIFISENPIHNGICWTVHETGIEETIAAHLERLYCKVTHDPACS